VAAPGPEIGPLASGVRPENLAYVIYTSGSTGRPKGTMNTHRGIVNRLLWMQEEYGLTAGDRVLQKTPFSFDVSVWEFFWPLLTGARLVMAKPGGHQDPGYLVRTIREEGITTLHFVPSMLQVFLEAPGVEECSSLKRVMCSGEALPLELTRRFFARLPQVSLHNLYGPTEAAVDVTYWPCDPREKRGVVPIGRPVANTEIHLLDPYGNPVPVGVPGELLIGGVQLGRGYLARPDLTAERFVPADGGLRLYRTGDLARYLPDGAIDFLGRIDHQVKVRGLRIELGEIESALASHPAVREAVVLARTGGSGALGGVNLAAYVTLKQGEAAPDLAQLRQLLSRSLPEYMLPSALVVLEAMPLTASGKVDRKALPEPERSGASEERVLPRTDLERLLARLWSETLHVAPESFGIHDSFFEIGGNSITGAIFINRLQQELGEIVHVVTIFDAPTIEKLAAFLRAEYPEAVGETGRGIGIGHPVDAGALEEVRGLIRTLPPLAHDPAAEKNPPAVFVLSPPRSGSTLLRVMLGGHPALFAPPELELLDFDTLPERRDAFPGRDAFRLEGLLRAVMEARGCGAEEARETVSGFEREGLSTQAMYRHLQEWIGGRTLVDKTPTYAWDPETLRRAEAGFGDARYVHLVRHPLGMIRSFEEARIDQIFFHEEHRFSRRELAELLWVLAHENTLAFLATIPAERRHTVRFEDLLSDPEGELRRICSFLGLPYDPAMAAPYEARSERMTDGLHAESRMLGDVKFHQHSGVDASVAERWREEYGEESLSDLARGLAARLGYELAPAPRHFVPIERVETGPGAPRPLSFAQERLWFLDQLDPGKATYNIPNALRLTGRLDVAALAASLAEVVRRHEVLRSTFTLAGGQPVQVAGPPSTAMPVVDLTAVPGELRAEEVRRRMAEEVDRPFDLSRGPLLRALLLRVAPEEHVAVLTLHHVASDGWSMGVLVREVAALYPALSQGRPSPLPELPIQYADFARWQRGWLQGEVLEQEIAYWRARLAGVAPLDLPTDRPRPPVQTFRGAALPLTLGSGTGEALEALGRRSGATFFMTALAAFMTLLHRYAGQDDIAVGTPSANRNRPEIEGLIGFFVNTLVVRADASGDPSFRELLGRVREASVGAFAHQDLPFEKVVEELRPERDLSRSPLFQVMFILQNLRAEPVKLPGLVLAPQPWEVTTAKLDLTLSLFEGAGHLTGSIEWNTDLFERATIERMAGHLKILLAGIAADPEKRLSELPLLSGAERRQILSEWNETARDWPRETLIHELFEQQAARRPEAVAVTFAGERWTYRDLDLRANRLAHHLRRLGVGPETRVGLAVERSAEMVSALLGVLKAGGAYVPLDPSHPAERLGMVLDDSAVSVLLTEEKLLSVLPPVNARIVCLDRDGEAIAAESAEAPERLGSEENLAYVIYTSGSTGRPKGVELPHRAVVNFLRAMAERPGLGEADAVPALTTLSFDIAGLEIYLPLAVGGRIEVVGRDEAADGARLAARLASSGATAAQATPATWRMLLESGWEGLPGLKVLCGGEALPRDLAQELLARGVELWNVYGPTETAVWSAVGEVTPGEGPVRLGRPIANTEFFIVDPGGGPVPVGVAGELRIGGEGLARGYLARPELTAERFVPHPWSARPGARLYRTGDLVRFREGGELEFLGRIDHQVKVRGFRIELGEIEAALARHPAVRQAVAAVHEEGGDKRLVAWLVPEGTAPTPGGLRDFLRRSLPEYMVPGAFVALPALPLPPSGKVDRKALPAPETGGPGEADAAPLTPVEEVVAAIWAEVLRRERVGARESFFDLGGHSLLATQVISRVRTALGVDLPLQRMFESPTVAGLARAVEEARREREGLAIPPIVPVPRDRPLPLSFSQERMWFLGQLDAGTSAYNLFRAVRLRGALDEAVLGRCLTELVRRHEALRTAFILVDGQPVQVVAPPRAFSLPRIDLRHLPAGERQAEARRLAGEEGARPFDLARGPLRATLLRIAEGAEGEAEHALLLAMHHIASDGWSMGVLIREMAVLYGAFAAGEPSPLPDLPVQYPDFAVWQRRVLSGEARQAGLDYWRRRLAGSPPPLLLPADRRRSAVQGFQVGVRAIELPAALLAGLHALSRRQSASLYMTLLAAWETLLLRATAQEDVVVGAPIANRNRAEIEGLIGFFLNTLVLRTDLSGNPGFEEALGRVRETALGAFTHQDLPLEQVLQAVHAERDAGRAAPFQVMFLLQNIPRQELSVPGLTFSLLESEHEAENLGTAIFEVGLTLTERPGEGLLASITYNALLFDEATIDRLLARYGLLLEGVAADPSRRLWDYGLMTPEERRELLAWSGAGAPATEDVPPVHRLFERQAGRDPDAVAVIGVEGRLTYGELDGRANRLARHLQALGVGPERVVGLCVERSPEMIVALLAVLKAGGAYVPLDPAYPVERLAYVVEDAGAAVLITTEKLLAARPALGARAARTVLLDADSEAIAGRSGEPPAVPVDPDRLAYLIYTSGSTGKPKGVMVRHGSLASYVAAFRDEHALTPRDRVLQFASIGFDTSAEEIYPCLASGAALALRTEAM
ncbi:MAG TPA: amino acid adenylation domain-containing protein, partial [Thermoanaerobaculia bacterium]|nr:amino acid adenylation domain-containing protein [Thermoanaerobaculia bacterium]